MNGVTILARIVNKKKPEYFCQQVGQRRANILLLKAHSQTYALLGRVENLASLGSSHSLILYYLKG
jgi:hypothetical protein